MSQLRGFLPWIVFSVVSGLACSWAGLLSLALGALFLARDRRAGVPADARILEFGTAVCFGVLTVAFVDPHAPVRDDGSGLSSAWPALIAVVTLLVGLPFVPGHRQAPYVTGGLGISCLPPHLCGADRCVGGGLRAQHGRHPRL